MNRRHAAARDLAMQDVRTDGLFRSRVDHETNVAIFVVFVQGCLRREPMPRNRVIDETKSRAGVLAAALVLAFTACGSSRPHCDLPLPRHGAPFLWRVQAADGAHGAVFLYGTIHDGAAVVPPAAWEALSHARHFASELGDAQPDTEKLVARARLPYGKVLSQMLPADDWWDLVNALRGAVREEELQHARPWFAMTRLTSHMTQSPKPSMDDTLTERAKHQHVPVDALETWDEQLAALDEAVTIEDLEEAIHARKEMACSLERMRALYDAGDLESITPLLAVRDPRLIAARNARWLPAIERYLTGEGAFVAVGLGHLVGDTGLPAELGRRGYKVERL